MTSSGPSSITPMAWASSGSTSAPSRVRIVSAPDGQRAIIAIICERTIVSSMAGRTIFHTFVTWLPQNPACSQIDRSSRTTIFVPWS